MVNAETRDEKNQRKEIRSGSGLRKYTEHAIGAVLLLKVSLRFGSEFQRRTKEKTIIRFTVSTKWKQTLQELCLVPAKREHWGNIWETSLGKDLRV